MDLDSPNIGTNRRPPGAEEGNQGSAKRRKARNSHGIVAGGGSMMGIPSEGLGGAGGGYSSYHSQHGPPSYPPYSGGGGGGGGGGSHMGSQGGGGGGGYMYHGQPPPSHQSHYGSSRGGWGGGVPSSGSRGGTGSAPHSPHGQRGNIFRQQGGGGHSSYPPDEPPPPGWYGQQGPPPMGNSGRGKHSSTHMGMSTPSRSNKSSGVGMDHPDHMSLTSSGKRPLKQQPQHWETGSGGGGGSSRGWPPQQPHGHWAGSGGGGPVMMGGRGGRGGGKGGMPPQHLMPGGSGPLGHHGQPLPNSPPRRVRAGTSMWGPMGSLSPGGRRYDNDDVVLCQSVMGDSGMIGMDEGPKRSSSGDKGRGSYRCGRCGVPKKGHVCPYQPKLKRRPDEPPPVMKNAATQVEIDEYMILRRLNLEIQGFPESYTSEPSNMVGSESRYQSPSRLTPPRDLGPPPSSLPAVTATISTSTGSVSNRNERMDLM